ncbi:hypothetical protein ACIBCA_11740 [Kitasatospora sp. NPDC051170]|uniref:hypothetical protein n=1 Tax=Kitasatospora sp. NPDC051170 TaxID=3364056 RepID=UPI003796337D
MRRVLGAVAITAGVVLGMQGCLPFGSDREERTVEYGVSGQVRELVVETENGGAVVAGGGDSVRVSEKWRWKGSEPSATHEVKDGVLTLRYSCEACGIGYTVHVPSSVKVRVKAENGGARLSGLAGEVDASVENGGVEATGLTGPKVRMHADNGGVKAEFTAAPAEVEATVGNGGVQLKVPAGEAYAVDARAKVGGTAVGIPSQAGAAHRLTARAETGGVSVGAV